MKIHRIAAWLTGLLLIQFILGMLANLYVEIPSDHPEQVFKRIGFISIHSAVAVLLLLLAIVFLWQSIKQKTKLVSAIGGLVSIAVAFVAGHLFVGTQNELYSFIMALGFLTAMFSYAPQARAQLPQEPQV